MTETRRAKLTKRSVERAAPADDRYILWDTNLPGFGLRVEPTGRRTFIARYRAGGGRTGTLRQSTLGRFGTITADQARALARKMLGKAAGGGDPLGDRHRERQAGLTVGEVCDWYLKEAESGQLLGRRGWPIKASTIAMDRSRIDTHVRPLVGRKRVAALTHADLEAMQATIAAGRSPASVTGKRRGGIVTGGSGVAARTLGMLATILEHARRNALIAVNPAMGTRKLSGQRRTDRLTLDQIRALGAAIRAASDENPVPLAAIRLILLAGLRRNEALSLRREWIMPAGGIDFPDTKSGPQVRPVGGAALGLIRQIAGGASDSGWVFPSERGTGHFVGLPKVFERIRTRAVLPPVSIHTLRHSFASVAGDLGFSELTIAGLLGHKSGSITASYVHLDSALVAAADRVAAVIAAALDGREPAAITQIRTATAR